MSADEPVNGDGYTPNSSSIFNLAGCMLGKYRLIEKIGQGGMAQVYKAFQPSLDRYVAIKVLHPHLTSDEDFAVRFQHEARAVAALEHPHIVRVYDFDADQGLAFLVMEYLEGQSLKSMLRELNCRGEQMELQEAGRIICALADALDCAHRQGMAHRDVKPSNVIITASGRPVLTDFGIARMVEATTATGSSGILGTPIYMSPEQGKGEPGDARSDIYALGVLLYQLCTGRVPFDADTPYAIVLKHISAPLPSPRSVRPDLPHAIERVILKALAKNPGDRFRSAGEMGHALRAAVESRETASVTPQRPQPGRVRTATRVMPSRNVLLGAILIVITFAFCLSLMFFTRGWRIQRYLDRVTPTPVARTTSLPPVERRRATLILEGPEVTSDTWIDPDTPGEFWHKTDLVHLQGPLAPDRILLRFDLSGLPANANPLSATLTLRTELWGKESFPGAAVIYRVLTPWEPDKTNYEQPWHKPGLATGIDYDLTPLDLALVPDQGWMTLDVTRAVEMWRKKDKPNDGLVLMMSENSHNQAHHWVYLSEQPDPADRPTLRITYEVAP